MTNLARLVILVLAVAGFSPALPAQQTSGQEAQREWWNEGPFSRPAENPQAKVLSLIHVEGNHFVDADGKQVLFKGLAIADPDKIERQGHWNRELFEQVEQMGAMVVRIPVHPVAWRERTPQKYLELLDQAVSWSTDLGVYVMIDWHSIGNLGMELFQNPMYNTTRRETFEFWKTIAAHFQGHNTVAFYEFFNEPTLFRGRLGSMSWSDWKTLNEKMIKLVRAYDPETIPLVAGLDWAYDLTPLHFDPIDAEGIGYVTHPYAHKRTPPWPPKWDEDFGFAANRYPVVATEFGFQIREGQTVSADDYPNMIIKYLESHDISWVGWCFDPQWGPRMLKTWDHFELTPAGEFFKKAMHGEIGD